MKKKSSICYFVIGLTVMLLVKPINISALNYTVSFTGSGASTTVESVIVQNLTKGTTVTVPTGNVLNLLDVTTSVDNISSNDAGIIIYPNPVTDKSTITFQAKEAGLAQINIYNLEGRKVAGISRNLAQGNNSFQFSIPKGTYSIQVQGNGYAYTSKLISHSNTAYTPTISFSGSICQNTNKPLKSKSEVTTMLYSSGDQLLYKGKSGNYTTIVTDIPSSTKTTNFEFVECKDADGNNYAVVKIGTQTWMAENLKTTRYNDLSLIPNITSNSDWSNLTSGGCCNYNNDLTNVDTYGRLYNWLATSDTRGIAPIGWHIPDKTDWNTLTDYLSKNSITGGGLKESSLSHWIFPNSGATNSTGFSALPAGTRYADGTYDGLGKLASWCSTTLLNPQIPLAGINSPVVFSNLSTFFSDSGIPFLCGISIRCIKN